MSTVQISRLVRAPVRATVGVSRQVRCVVGGAGRVGLSRTVRWPVRAVAQAAATVQAAVAAVPATAQPGYLQTGPFVRVYTDYLVLTTPRVSWELSPRFFAPGPFTFQLQAAGTDDQAADDWVDVGNQVVDGYFQVDQRTDREHGQARLTGYRVLLTTGDGGRYVSAPANTLGNLNWKDWRLGQEVVRKEKLRHRWFASVVGLLYKRRRAGAACTRCFDRATAAATDSRCPVCLGTGWVTGYYPPVPAHYADVTQEQSDERRAPEGIGMVLPVAVRGRFIGWPLPAAQDVWVNVHADLRYAVGKIEVAAQQRAVPLVVTAELRRLPPEDVAFTLQPPAGATYDLPVPETTR